jgi:formate--tetrahydrofolate ligase
MDPGRVGAASTTVITAAMVDILHIARSLGLSDDAIEARGRGVLKVDPDLVPGAERGRVVLVTAMTPTPAGEGKTTTTIGLVDGLRRRGVKAVGALREPSLGPLFGLKGGAVGGGKARIVPDDAINMHFTGDLHAVTSAHNLLTAIAENHQMCSSGTIGACAPSRSAPPTSTPTRAASTSPLRRRSWPCSA